jgi:hypothetical protein
MRIVDFGVIWKSAVVEAIFDDGLRAACGTSFGPTRSSLNPSAARAALAGRHRPFRRAAARPVPDLVVFPRRMIRVGGPSAGSTTRSAPSRSTRPPPRTWRRATWPSCGPCRR